MRILLVVCILLIFVTGCTPLHLLPPLMFEDLSFGERKLYDTAHTLLIKELSTAKDSDEKAVAKEIEALFDFDKE